MPNDTAVAQFNLAINSGYGEKQITTFYRCSLFGKRAETLAPMLLKGNKIGVTGEITNRPYTNKEGVEKYSLELRVNDLTLLGSKGEGKPESQPESQPESHTKHGNSFDDLESNIPF